MNDTKALLLILIMAGVTFLIRALPFVVFNKKETPEFIGYLGKVLPYSIMAMLVVYCLKDISIINSPHGLPEIIAIVVTALLHIYKRNTLLSIISGTICYMLLIQFVF